MEEASLRAKFMIPSYSDAVMRQELGPLKMFVIPEGHSRQSRYRLFRRALKDLNATMEVDFDRNLSAFECGEPGDDLMETAPLDLLAVLRSWA